MRSLLRCLSPTLTGGMGGGNCSKSTHLGSAFIVIDVLQLWGVIWDLSFALQLVLMSVVLDGVLQHLRRRGPGQMAEQGGHLRKATAWPGMGSMHRHERASKRSLSRKECDLARGH